MESTFFPHTNSFQYCVKVKTTRRLGRGPEDCTYKSRDEVSRDIRRIIGESRTERERGYYEDTGGTSFTVVAGVWRGGLLHS